MRKVICIWTHPSGESRTFVCPARNFGDLARYIVDFAPSWPADRLAAVRARNSRANTRD